MSHIPVTTRYDWKSRAGFGENAAEAPLSTTADNADECSSAASGGDAIGRKCSTTIGQSGLFTVMLWQSVISFASTGILQFELRKTKRHSHSCILNCKNV